MRWIIISFLLLISATASARFNRAWIGDTTKVKVISHEGDTTFFPKTSIDRPDTFIAYYDAGLTRKAQWSYWGNQIFNDSSWFRNGTLKSWRHFNGDPVCYNQRAWYANGILKRRSDCTGDTNVSFSYYNSGKIKMKTIAYRDSSFPFLTERYVAEYYENGQLIFDVGDPSLPVQTRRKYYPNGQMMWELNLRYHFAVGPFIEWYANGQIKTKGNFSEVRTGNSDVKTGKWSYYNESGKLIKEEFYEEGKLVKTVEY